MIRARLAFYALTLTGVSTLIGAFAHPLQKVEVWTQLEYGAFGSTYHKKFLLRESAQDYPYGFDQQRAVKIAQVYQDAKGMKIGLILISLFSSGIAQLLGKRIVAKSDLDTEIERINQQSKQQLQLRQVKHNAALAAKSQELLHRYEIEEFVAEYGNPDGNDAQVEEQLATDPFTRCLFLTQDGIAEADAVAMVWDCSVGSTQHSSQLQRYRQWLGEDDPISTIAPVDFRSEFPEAMDYSTRKAIYKALGDGASEDEIVREVLGCCPSKEPLGRAYLLYLKHC